MRNSSLNTGRSWCLALLLAIQIAIVGCGGGDVEEPVSADSTHLPVNCSATPKVCQ